MVAATRPTSAKTRITIRLDNEVLRWFKGRAQQSGRGGYQSLINMALRDHVRSETGPLEAALRRVLREELPKYRTSRK